MPAGDKTGPRGKGPGTGRGLGPCKSGFIGGHPSVPQRKGAARRRRFGPPQIGFGKGFLKGN